VTEIEKIQHYCWILHGAGTGFDLSLQNGCYQLQTPFLCGFLELSEFSQIAVCLLSFATVSVKFP
jgi:hypothetical protein